MFMELGRQCPRAGHAGTLNSEPCTPLIPAPRDGQDSFLPWTGSSRGGVDRDANPWRQEGREEFLWLWTQTGSDLSQVLRQGSSLAELLNFLNWGPF